MEKNNVPYYQVAKEALIKWNGLTEEQADKIIKESSFEKIEGQIYAQGSMTYAVNAIGRNFGLNDEEIAKFSDEVFGRTDSREIMERLQNKLRTVNFTSIKQINIYKVIVDTMEAVHDGWVEDNAKLFFTKKADRGQQYQYLPLELIGWDEAKSDLLFIKPIIHSIGIYADDTKTKEEYNKRTVTFFKRLDSNIHNIDCLENAIVENGLKYNHWTPEIEEAMGDSKFVKEIILPELRKKGFMKDKELINTLISREKLQMPQTQNGGESR